MTQTISTCNNQSSNVVKFLYSYGGKITTRGSDGKLRYIGGHTRVLSVQRSITFAELMIKFEESCGESMSLRCKLPTEDLDLLVSIGSDEDLKNVVEEYNRFSLLVEQETKIVAILAPNNSVKKMISPPSSPMSCFDFLVAATPKSKSRFSFVAANRFNSVPVGRNRDSLGLGRYGYQHQLSKRLFSHEFSGTIASIDCRFCLYHTSNT